jgi:hypothetical protein
MWQARLDDGTVATEATHKWASIKSRVVGLSFIKDGATYSLPEDQQEYMRAKTGSAPLMGGEITVESEWIGFRDNGGRVVKLRFFSSGNMAVEVE